jgi:hypothetical protein
LDSRFRGNDELVDGPVAFGWRGPFRFWCDLTIIRDSRFRGNDEIYAVEGEWRENRT